MCVFRYCPHSEIMHVMMGRTHITYTLDKKHKCMCGQKTS